MIALREAYQAGLFKREQWLPNIIAGVIVGVVALPLAMAFAIATGAKPEQGIYTAIIAALVVSIFGGSRLQIAGPTGAFVVVLAGIVNTYGMAGLQLATIMAGILLVLMGIFRMGIILRFIPAPVILGFTAGIGVVIWVGQWPSFFGFEAPEGDHFHQKLPELVRSFGDLDIPTTSLAVLGLLIVIFAPRLPRMKRVPSPLVAMVVVTLIQVIFDFDSVATIGSQFGGIPTGLPAFDAPEVSLDLVINLLGPAFTIAMLGAIESLLSAVVADGMAGTRHDSNQELKGQGIANVAVGFFGGIAATGAIARTATNIRNGGTSPLSGIVHSVVLLAIILVLAPLASSIPLAVLAAILFIVSWNMSEARHFVRMIRRAPVADVAILITTFILTVAADLVVAVNVGVLLATLQFLRRMASSVDVQPVSSGHVDLIANGNGNEPRTIPDGVAVYAIQGPFFFAAVESFERALAQTHTDPRVVIIRLGVVPFIDITGLQAIEEVIEDFHERGVHVILCEANDRVMTKLTRAHLVGEGQKALYEGTLVESLDQASHLVNERSLLEATA
jgi:SulP family sulfate permease